MTNLNESDFLGAYVSLPNNLFALLAKYHVIVPGIQRHYVQGEDHPHAKEVRKQFIGDILKGCREKKPVCLDFIYGPVETVGADAFIPVDGQQRLTTIWLLARYFAEFTDELTRDQVLQLLSRFTYEDRTHATRFCCELTKQENRYAYGGRPSEAIGRALWFNPFWRKDSTVAAMLNTLDTIHELWQDDGLAKIESKDMLHYIGTQLMFRLCVDTFGQDIYMKMNARGLTLTQWENFKGRFAALVNKSDASESLRWNERIEALSNAYHGRAHDLPDNAFFAFMARIFVYETRAIKLDSSVVPNIIKLAKFADTDWIKELPHVPFGEFESLLGKLQTLPSKVAQSFLDLITFVTGAEDFATIFTPYWQTERKMLQCLFCPKNKKELDFSLCLYEYFKKFPAPNSEDFNLALRLIWNILENVSIGDNENQYNRVTGVTQIIQTGCQSLYPEKMASPNESILQYAEEAEKASIYAKKAKEDIALMQSVEELMHGRIRLGLINLEKNELSFRRERLAILEKLFELYEKLENRKHIVLMVVAAESVELKDVITLSVDEQNLRKLLTSQDDKCLQTALLDYLAGCQDIMQTDCLDILDKNRSKFIPKQWWERDWRKTIIQIGFRKNGYELISDDQLWGRAVKWHHYSGRYYLYAPSFSTIRYAWPINDYRIELLLPENTINYKELGKSFDSVEMNDGETRSGKFEPNESRNDEKFLPRSVYFYRDHVEVRQWDDVERKFLPPTIIPSEYKDVGYSVDKLLADLRAELK